MRLEKIYIKGFRNFKEAIIRFNDHSLIIGANDVGKTNLLYALRLLMDKGFSDYDFELKESDYCIYSDEKKVVIRCYFSNIAEGCLIAHMKGDISEDKCTVIQYEAEFINGKTEYQFKTGKSDSDEDLAVKDTPYYRRYLNIKYIGSKREFWNYINKVKVQLLTDAKLRRTEENETSDDALHAEIKAQLKEVDSKIPSLSYVKKATDEINDELTKLSAHNFEQKIVFDLASSDLDQMIRSVSLSATYGDQKLLIGGEGRINQIYLSLWATQNKQANPPTEVSILCIEEPETYLHPHQQRELAKYLGNKLPGQVILTSHSPYIACEYSPNSIIRLYKNRANLTQIASDGCSEIIGDKIEDFGYRMSILPAEAFYSDFAVLVEGQSEMIFYKTLAVQLGLDLDHLNISVLSVEGVGFDTYINVLDALCIGWCIRTDNDILKIPKKNAFRYAGIERGLAILAKYDIKKDEKDRIEVLKPKIHGFADKNNIPQDVKDASDELKSILARYNILIANIGLEEDLFYSPIQEDLKKYYGEDLNDDEVISEMKDRKATNMYNFLKECKSCLVKLIGDPLTSPLMIAKSHIENLYGATH